MGGGEDFGELELGFEDDSWFVLNCYKADDHQSSSHRMDKHSKGQSEE